MINQVHKGIIIKIIKVRKVTKPIVNRDENEMHDYVFFYICCSPQGGARVCVYWTESIYISSSLQSLQMARSRPARRSSFSQARISAVSGERWLWRGGEDGGVVGGGGDGDDGVGGAGGESGADRRSSSSQARIRVVSQSRW